MKVSASVLEDDPSGIGMRVVDALSRNVPAEVAVTTALTMLTDDAANIRVFAIETLTRVDHGQPEVARALVEALKDNEPEVRSSTAAALGKLGQKQSDWTDEMMLELLQDNDSGQRELAGIVLAYRERLSPAVVEQIRKLRKDDRPWVRMAALHALTRIQDVRFEREEQARAKTAADQPAAP